jgi:hypothetical protein
VTTVPDVRHPKAPRAQRTRHNALVARAIQGDDSSSVVAAIAEVHPRTAQIAGAFLACGGHEINRPARDQPMTIDLFGQREHHRQTAAVVVDPRPHPSGAIAVHSKLGPSRKHCVQMRTDDDRLLGLVSVCPFFASRATTCDVARFVDPYVG